MVFPLLLCLLGFLAVLGYFSRKNIVYFEKKGTGGSVGMGFVMLLIFALIGWGMDAWLSWSVIPRFMYSVGGTLQMLSIAFYAAFSLLCLSMLYSSVRCGQLVA